MKLKLCIFLIIIISLTGGAAAYAEGSGGLNYPLILMYHRISDSEAEDAFTISAEKFESDIRYLKEQGYRFYKAEDMGKTGEGGTKSVIITFDDGYDSDLKIALPILQKYNACATFFVIGSKIGESGYMSREDIKKLSASENAQIGNHSYAVHQLEAVEVKEIYAKDANKVISDFEENQKLLEQITGKKITAYSYPYGIYGNFVDFELKRRGCVTFGSEERVGALQPYGRFNRSSELTIEQIIDKAEKKYFKGQYKRIYGKTMKLYIEMY